MELIKAALQSPGSNLLGIFIYLSLLFVCTILFVSLLLYLIPNKLSTGWKNAIIGTSTVLVLLIWLYFFVIRAHF